MEMEAVVEERASLETQLHCLRTQINSLTLEVEEHKLKVKLDICFDKFFGGKIRGLCPYFAGCCHKE